MKIAIFGAGAIGGLLAAKLAIAGRDVTCIARGPHLAAIHARGLILREDGTETVTRPAATDRGDEAGPQDYVIIAVKAHSLPAAVPQILPMLGPETTVVTAINGVPYWYFHGLEGPFADRRLNSVDPGGVVWDALPPTRALGCIVYPAAEITAPGIVEHGYGDRFSLGEPDGSRSPRAQALSAALIAAGFKAPVRPRIRDEIWVKLWGNLAFNPLSALTGQTLDVIIGDADTRDIARRMMVEAQAVAEAIGVRFAIGVEQRIDGAAEVGRHKTSMLQDLERGRPMEIDALLGAVVEIADLVERPVPTCRMILTLVRQRARAAGCYPAG